MTRTSFGGERIKIIRSVLMRQHSRILELDPTVDLIKLPNLAALVLSASTAWCWCINSLVSLGGSPTVSSSGDGDCSLLRSGLLFFEVWSRIGSPIAELAVEQLHQHALRRLVNKSAGFTSPCSFQSWMAPVRTISCTHKVWV